MDELVLMSSVSMLSLIPLLTELLSSQLEGERQETEGEGEGGREGDLL